jgi:urease accessory protein
MTFILTIFFKIIFVLSFFIIDAHAHSLVNSYTGFGSGFSHPMLGLDHFLAMFSVGVWGAQMGGRKIWLLPMSFPLIMCFGALIAISKIFAFILVEQVISFSVILLGFVILVKWSPNELIAILVISIFALFHGYAHGFELPRSNDPLSFIIGFVLSTGLIHLFGIGVGYFLDKFYNGKISRIIGFLISINGLIFLFRIYT